MTTLSQDDLSTAGPAGVDPGAIPRAGTLRRRVVLGSAWTIGGFAAMMVLRLGGNVMLTRILAPEAFGLVSLVFVFLSGLEVFSELGVGHSVIQHPRGDDPRFLGTAWTVQLIRGLALFAGAAVLAWPAAVWWFRKPELVPLMIVAGASPLIVSLNSTKLMSCSRHLELRRLQLLDLTAYVVGLVTMLALAVLTRSVWALIGGSLVTAAVKVILGYAALPGHTVRPSWDREVLGELTRFGRWILLSSLLGFLAGQGDRLLLGRYLDEVTLGVYSIAFLLSDAAVRVVFAVCHHVLFPAFGQVARADRGRLPIVYERSRRWIYLIMLPGAGCLIGAGPAIVDLLYDERYQIAGVMVQILAIRVVVECLLTPGVSALLALGRPEYNAIGLGLKVVWVALGVPLGYQFWGILGAVWVVGLSVVAMAPALLWGLWRHGLFRPWVDALGIALTLGSAAFWYWVSGVIAAPPW